MNAPMTLDELQAVVAVITRASDALLRAADVIEHREARHSAAKGAGAAAARKAREAAAELRDLL